MELQGAPTHKFHRWLISAVLKESAWRSRNNRNFDYYENDQWTDEEKLILEERGQQATVLNIVRPTIDTVLALEFEKKLDLQIVPREPSDEDVSTLLTELLKQIYDESNSEFFESEAFREGVIGGRGALQAVLTQDDSGRGQIIEEWVPWEEIYVDPFHRRPDGSDARFIIREVWMDIDEVKSEYPDVADKVASTFTDDYKGIEYHGQMESGSRFDYYDHVSQRVRICNCYYRDAKGDVRFCAFSDEIFFVGGPEDNDNEDPLGINMFPIVLFYCFRTRKGDPKGLVEYLIDAQDQINKINSKYIWNISANRLIVEDGALADDYEEAQEQYNRPDGILKLNAGGLSKIKVEDNLRESAHLTNQLQFLIAMAQRTSGVNDSMLGVGGVNERSASQQQTRIMRGANIQTRILLNLQFTKRRMAQILLRLVGDYYNEERIVRISRPNGEYEMVTLNQPVEMDEHGVIQRVNNIRDTLRYDVVLKMVQPFNTVRELQLQYFSEAAKSGALPGSLAGEIMIELSDLPNKTEYIQRLQSVQQQLIAAQQQQPQ